MGHMKCNNNKMLMHGLILVTILATAKSAEAEITMEAAFQGHCGHTSPCEQLCYEIHDGMYECDCIEGYELNKNGYSCQVINSTSTSEGHSKSDEDVLYQKGASFSAKLAGNGNLVATGNGISMTSYETIAARVAAVDGGDGDDDDGDGDGDGDGGGGEGVGGASSRGSSASTEENDYGGEDADDLVDSFFNQGMSVQKQQQRQQQKQQQQQYHKQQKQQQQLDKVNSQDYYISAESINYSTEQDRYSVNPNTNTNNNNKNNKNNNKNTKKNKKHINSPVVPDYKANAYTDDDDDDDDDGNDGNEHNKNSNHNGDGDGDADVTDEMSRIDLVNSQQRSTARPTTTSAIKTQPPNAHKKPLKKSKKKLANKFGDIKFKLSLRNNGMTGATGGAAAGGTTTTTTKSAITPTTVKPAAIKITGNSNDNGDDGDGGDGDDDDDDDDDVSNVHDDYYAKQELDMSVYDDVNNNQLNLRPLGHQNRYEYEYHQHQHQQQRQQQQQQKSQHQNTYQQQQQKQKQKQQQQREREQHEQSMLITGAAAIAATGGRLPASASGSTPTQPPPMMPAISSENKHHTSSNNNNNNNINNNNNKEAVNGGGDAEAAAISVTNKEILGISMTMTGASVVNDMLLSPASAVVVKNTNISTMESVECNLDCGVDGVCERIAIENAPPTMNGAGNAHSRCLCPFGKANNGCSEEIKVRVPKFSKRSWLAFPALRGAYKHVQLRIEFRPEAFDGILLLSGERDDLTGDFMALLLNKGFVEFWFDCGSGVGSVRSRETIMLNEWNSVIIYRHRWDAWLVLNHGTKVQGRSNGLFSRITFREPVFLGGTGNITGLAKRLPIFNGFTGCIRRFVANEHDYKFDEHPIGDVANGFDIQDCITDKCFKYPCQHGGKCLPSDQGAVCLCPIGYVGDLCEIRMDLQVPAFNGSSFLRYAPLGDSMLIWMELKVIFKPEHPDGLIMYSGPEKHGDFIALSLSEGFVEFTFDLGSGPAVVRSEYPVTIGQWHTVQVSRTARLAVLKIDESPEVMTISTNGFWHLSLPDNLFVGGVNHVDRLPLDLKYKPFFVGCIQKIDINGHALAIISEALGGTNIGNCPHACVARPCGPLAECVPQMESYECRCSAYNAQCNKAAEMSLEELQRSKMAKNHAKQLGNVNHPMKVKKSGVYHKQSKIHHSKGLAHRSKQMMTSNVDQPTSSTTTSTTTSKPTTTTTTSRPFDLIEDDDIIFRDVHGMHRKYGHQKPPTPSHTTPPPTTRPKQTQSKLSHISKHLSKVHHPDEGSNNSGGGIGGGGFKKYDAHHKYVAFEPRKLSRLPTHYESFQTDSESDILTFDDNVEVELRLPAIGPAVSQSAEESDEEWSFVDTPAEVEQLHDTTTKPFILDEALFDGSDETEDYQRKQLAQDMRRIMTNPRIDEMKMHTTPRTTTPSTTKTTTTTTTKSTPKLVTDSYRDDDAASLYESDEWDDDYSEEDAKLIATARRNNEAERHYKIDKNMETIAIIDRDAMNDDNDNNDGSNDGDGESNGNADGYDDDDDDDDVNDELLSAVRQTVKPSSSAASAALQLQPNAHPVTTPQTHTDWSLLKKLDLTAEQAQAHTIGVRKNFGACFAGKDSYFHYNDAETMSQIISYNIDLNLRIKTHSPDGVILWTGRQGDVDDDDDNMDDDNNNNNNYNNNNNDDGDDDDGSIENIGDFLSLGIENGYLHFRYDLGSGEVDIRYNVSRVSDGLWHRVRAIRNSQEGYLEVDGRKSLTQRSPGHLRQLNTDTGLYVGGMPELSYFTRRKYNSGIVGCISEIILAGELKLNFDPNTLGTSHNVETGIL